MVGEEGWRSCPCPLQVLPSSPRRGKGGTGLQAGARGAFGCQGCSSPSAVRVEAGGSRGVPNAEGGAPRAVAAVLRAAAAAAAAAGLGIAAASSRSLRERHLHLHSDQAVPAGGPFSLCDACGASQFSGSLLEVCSIKPSIGGTGGRPHPRRSKFCAVGGRDGPVVASVHQAVEQRALAAGRAVCAGGESPEGAGAGGSGSALLSSPLLTALTLLRCSQARPVARQRRSCTELLSLHSSTEFLSLGTCKEPRKALQLPEYPNSGVIELQNVGALWVGRREERTGVRTARVAGLETTPLGVRSIAIGAIGTACIALCAPGRRAQVHLQAPLPQDLQRPLRRELRRRHAAGGGQRGESAPADRPACLSRGRAAHCVLGPTVR